MIIFISLVLIVFIAAIAESKVNDNRFEIPATIILFCILAVANIITFSASYSTAVDIDVVKQGIISEYRNSISLYEDKAVLKINDKTLTDFRYQGYQQNMASMIEELRSMVHNHNQILLQKIHFSKNPFLSWYIILPEDTRLIHVVE